jgi:2-dehydro-3-deoxyphosphogalactonate aldolase
MNFEEALAEMPIVAILRGVTPEAVLTVTEALVSAGIRIVEVPLNSPQPVESIARLTRGFSRKVICGAGTVLTAAGVDMVCDAGGRLIVTPNSNSRVIARCREKGLTVMPGFLTPTEAFVALEAGAKYLKLFPAGVFGPTYLKALNSVLPIPTSVFPVGGVGADDISAWWTAGAAGFGIGTDLFTPGAEAAEVYQRAATIVQACRQAMTK